MSQSLSRHDDLKEYSYARDEAQSGRAIDFSPPRRPHPYDRRPSLPFAEYSSRINLPVPVHEGSSRPDAPRFIPGSPSEPINIPGISTLATRDGAWQNTAERDRYWDDRRHDERSAGDRVPMSRTASTSSGHHHQVRLPSIHSLSRSEPQPGESSAFETVQAPMPPPPRPRTNPPSPRFAYARPASPRHSSSHSLRPSYTQSRSYERREADDRHHAARDTTPPLRSVHAYESPLLYPHSMGKHYLPPAGGKSTGQAYHGHQHMHPAPFAHRVSHQPVYKDGPRRPEEDRAGPSSAGQSRRLAHLMSEQKRRESINTGFVGLRKVVPNASVTDSKAVILRKAAAHIIHLEAIIQSRQSEGQAAYEDGRARSAEASDSQYRENSENGEDSTGSSELESHDVKMERAGTEENDWRPPS